MKSGGYVPFNDAERYRLHQKLLPDIVGSAPPYKLMKWGALLPGINVHNISVIVIDYTYGDSLED